MSTDDPCLCDCVDPCMRGFSCGDGCKCFPCRTCHPKHFRDGMRTVEQPAESPRRSGREDIERFLTDEGRAKVAAFVAEAKLDCDDDFDLDDVLAQNLADHAAVYDPAPEPAPGNEIASRINQVALAHATVRPDMDPERFTELLLMKRTATSLDLALIADAFKVTVPWLVTGDDHAWCEDTLVSLQEELAAERCRTAELKQALVRIRAARADCPDAHMRVKTYFSDDEGCDLAECSCGWTYDAEENCPGIGDVDD